ncbi:adenosylcobinamide-phosphate synthase CbiB [Halalkalibacter kiskunsagensis]|uniref:Cobalamin biosynthesis protein CobD n=1 Tax=Halalkalibacter kiskunsagensis TaxID=1548599 RepID=A0ABV6KJC7_9BACI
MLGYLSTFNDPIIILCVILLAAILLDLIIGDPCWIPHPVVQMGKLISFLETRWNRGQRRMRKGIILTVTVILSIFCISFSIVFFAYQLHPVAGVLVEIYLISTTIAIKGLRTAAKNVLTPLVQGNLVEARKNVSMVVGRDTKSLPESEVVRGTVETVAENTVDGITAPLFWAIIGGAPLAMVYRAINTLDSMVGYKNERFMQFGWASAKLDDVANWIPARVTALSMWIASFFIRGSRMKHGVKITWRDARKHPSPNSGWSEAMVAGLLGIQLGGVNYYSGVKSIRATMGDPLRKLVRSDIEKSILYMHGGWIVFFVMGVCFLFLFR